MIYCGCWSAYEQIAWKHGLEYHGCFALAKICGSLVMETTSVSSSSNSQSTASSSSSQPSSGTITRIDTSTGNVAISGFSRVTVGKGTSITVNGNRVKNEGDLMVGDRCTVRMESYDLYAQNLICTR